MHRANLRLSTPANLETCLHEHVPLTRAMMVTVIEITAEHARLTAAGLPSRLVIQRHSIKFLVPMSA